jgi:putative hydrolase of the HAD superfamily
MFGPYRRRVERRLLRAYLISRICRRELDPLKELRAVHATWGMVMPPDALIELARQYYAPTLAMAHARPETPAALAELSRRGYKLAIVSNTVSPAPGLDSHLVSEGLLEFFPVRIYSCVFGVPKPNPRIFRAVLEELNVSAAQAVYVGDKPRIDVRGALRVGMRSVLRAANGLASPRRPRADRLIREIADLLDILPGRAT